VGPFVYEPTILTGVTPSMRVHTEETFGPVVAVHPVGSDEEAITAVNDTPYGLNASVWTRDAAAGRAIAARLEVGTVNVNEVYAATWGSADAPTGGKKASGTGRRHGRDGLLKYTEAQTVAVERLLPLTPPRGMPPRRWARLLTWALRARRWTPGLR
jgi:succinate-semialdehyde dehydrogenase/glutarate-semialdehyde dehydrogenase